MKKSNKDIIELFHKYSIADIALDSRKVKLNGAFFALKGITQDGNNFIENALKQGAKIIISDQISNEERNIYQVEDAKSALTESIKYFFNSLPNHLVAVTGTNGKSSVVNYFMQILGFLNIPAASLGSLGVLTVPTHIKVTDINFDTDLNTQDIITFHKILKNLKIKNIENVAFEASSHGLEQGRINGVKVKVAAFTSFSQDHLDFHGTMENYLQAKLKLFKENLCKDGIAIINSDMPKFDYVKQYIENLGTRYLTIGAGGELKILKINSHIDKQNIEFEYKGKSYNFTTKVIGGFQASNILIAAIMVESCGYEFEEIIKVLPNIIPVAGRMERVQTKKNIFVDHSHKPEALEKALTVLGDLKDSNARLIVVFGCGGNRDRIKRPIMGKIAASITDIAIITDDNPRDEEPADIRREIIKGTTEAINAIGEVIEIEGRRNAINYAISNMSDKDILLIAGKGHEEYQIIKGQKFNFSDVKVAKEISEEL